MKSFITLKEINELLEQGKIESSEVFNFFRQRAVDYNSSINALIEIFPEHLKSSAYKKGHLNGIPGVLKDNICYADHITSAGSAMLSSYKAPYHATVTERILQQGGCILGRANMDEFAMGSSGEFSAYGPAKNPWDLKRSPGGSSSGSAAAVAAGIVPWALGSETGGSVRQPAASCGLVGLYPTYGLFSRYGVIAFASSLDQVGPLTRTVYDNAYIASVLSGHDPKDSTSLPEPRRVYYKKLEEKMPEKIVIGIPEECLEMEGIHPEVRKAFTDAIADLERVGAEIRYLHLDNLKYGISVYFIISRAEAASNLARFDGSLYGSRIENSSSIHEMYAKTRQEKFGAEVKRRILMGNYVLSAEHRSTFFDKACYMRRMIRAEFEAAFKEVSCILTPTTATLPFTLGKECNDPLAMYLNDYFSVPSNIAGLPALAVPAGFSKDKLPIGIQFIGPRLSEELLYKVAYAYEQHTQYYQETPHGF